MRFAAWVALVLGAIMIGQWGFFIMAGQVPQFVTDPYGIAFHLASEVATAVTLIVAGALLLRGRRGAARLALVAFGMLVYAAINAAGYFAQLGQWAMVATFAPVVAFALAAVAQLFAVLAER